MAIRIVVRDDEVDATLSEHTAHWILVAVVAFQEVETEYDSFGRSLSTKTRAMRELYFEKEPA